MTMIIFSSPRSWFLIVAATALIIATEYFEDVGLLNMISKAMESGGIIRETEAIAIENTTTSSTMRASPIRRLFLRYESSKWEKDWLSVIDSLVKVRYAKARPGICGKIQRDSELVLRYLNATCNRFSTLGGPWCIVDDTYRPIYLDTSTGRAIAAPPRTHRFTGSFTNISTTVINEMNADVFSRFVFWNEATNETFYEYIEPLVAYLRHPLSCCEDFYNYSTKFSPKPQPNSPHCYGYLRTSRTQYIPPSPTMRRISHGGTFPDSTKYYYFDAGASDWEGGKGGPSLTYFYDLWKLHGLTFDKIYAYEAATTEEKFNETLPAAHQNLVQYQQVYVRSQVNDSIHPNGPFLPHEIQRIANKDDYVLFKLDIDSPGVEEGNVEYLLDPKNDILDWIDEFFYEFHVEKAPWKISEWYNNFLAMRQRGVRAHSWI
jgi:hypothetical protein